MLYECILLCVARHRNDESYCLRCGSKSHYVRMRLAKKGWLNNDHPLRRCRIS